MSIAATHITAGWPGVVCSGATVTIPGGWCGRRQVSYMQRPTWTVSVGVYMLHMCCDWCSQERVLWWASASQQGALKRRLAVGLTSTHVQCTYRSRRWPRYSTRLSLGEVRGWSLCCAYSVCRWYHTHTSFRWCAYLRGAYQGLERGPVMAEGMKTSVRDQPGSAPRSRRPALRAPLAGASGTSG